MCKLSSTVVNNNNNRKGFLKKKTSWKYFRLLICFSLSYSSLLVSKPMSN